MNMLGRGRLLRIKPVLASGYIAALGYLGVLATRWVWVVTLAEVTEGNEAKNSSTRTSHGLARDGQAAGDDKSTDAP